MRYWLLLPPFATYHHSSMSNQLLMWLITLHIRVYYTQCKVSARVWNARGYGWRSEYIKSVYQHYYSVADMKVTELTQRHGKSSLTNTVYDKLLNAKATRWNSVATLMLKSFPYNKNEKSLHFPTQAEAKNAIIFSHNIWPWNATYYIRCIIKCARSKLQV